ncbi:MAG: rhomboid family intramembrane serine protease, partial [Candidatus Acidiferrales bacterium]
MLSPRLRWKLDRLRERLAELFASPEPKPNVCFNCGKLVGAVQTVCPECGANQSAVSFSALKRIGMAAIPAENPVTYALLFANFLLYAVAWIASLRLADEPPSLFASMNPQVMILLGAKHGLLVLSGELWRLVMPNFLHWSLWHIGFNMIALWQIGPQVEEIFGSRRYLFLYLATGVSGLLASTVWYPMGLSAGASASIFGFIGVLISYLGPRPGFAREYRSQLIRWAVIILIMGLFLPFDNAGHIGGLVAGLILGRVVSDRRAATPGARFRLALMTWGSALALVW